MNDAYTPEPEKREPYRKGSLNATMSAYRVSETTSEGRMLALFSYYGIWAETKMLALDWEDLYCEGCHGLLTATKEDGYPKPLFVSSLEEVAPNTCFDCHKKAVRPRVYLPDFILDKKRKIVAEVYGEKSSTFDKAKLDYYRRAGITMIPVPNELTKEPKSAKALCAALALALGSDHPERLTEAEIA